jgi:histidinol-phosphatase (PHP family)
MNLSCAKAVELGWPAVTFTEHIDFTPFRAGYLREMFQQSVNDAGILVAPEFDVEGYFDCIEECHSNYPGLTILTGLEVGQPHRHREQLAELLGRREFQRVLGSLHCLHDGDSFAEPFELFPRYQASQVLRDYLEEISRMVDGYTFFEIVSHIDYVIRLWPDDAEPFSATGFETVKRR